MTDQLRMAEAVCVGHPDRLADTIAERIVDLACGRDADALVGVEVALHRSAVFVDGRIAAGQGTECAVTLDELRALVRGVYRDAGYGPSSAGSGFMPDPDRLAMTFDLCLGPLSADEREIRAVSDDQCVCVGHAAWGPRAGHLPLEQALANDFAHALERLRRSTPGLRLGPDGKVLVVVRGRALAGVSISVHHEPGAEWLAITSAVRGACERVAQEYLDARELDPLAGVDWLVNGAGAFEIGGPEGDNGLSGKKLVAQAYGTAVPIGGGARYGKDRHKVDPRGQALARQMALDLVLSRQADEATVWLAWRPGDAEPRWTEVVTRACARGPSDPA